MKGRPPFGGACTITGAGGKLGREAPGESRVEEGEVPVAEFPGSDSAPGALSRVVALRGMVIPIAVAVISRS